jgi:ferredoxin
MIHQAEPKSDNDGDGKQRLNRRMFLKATGILTAGALAGCLPQAENGDVLSPSTTTSEPTVSALTDIAAPTETMPSAVAPPAVPTPTHATAQVFTGCTGGHVITALCLRDSACVDVCPVEAIVGGKPEEEWPWYMIDPDTCIDCGACVPECPYEAIFPCDEVPAAYVLRDGQYLVNTEDRLPYGKPLSGEVNGHPVKIANAWAPGEGYLVDLTPAIQINRRFFSEGPGYAARS